MPNILGKADVPAPASTDYLYLVTTPDATPADGKARLANLLSWKLSSLGSRMLAFGHSYITGGGASDANQQYITLLSGMLRCDLVDRGVGGSEIANDEVWMGQAQGAGGWASVLQAFAPTKAAPYVPENVLPWVHFGSNDLQSHAHDASGVPRTIFKTALRTVLSRLAAAKVFEDSDATVALGGTTWQGAVLDVSRNSGTQYRPIPGNAATISITLPADFEGGTIAIGFTVWPLGDGQITWSTPNGLSALPATTVLSGLAYAANGVVASLRRDSSNGHVVRLTGLTAADASKTLVGTYGSGAGTAQATPAQPGALTVNGAAGAVTYGYKRVYRYYNGDTIPSTERTVATGNATLTGTNSITIPTGGAWPAGVMQELILRTTSGGTPASTGLIMVLNAPGAFIDTGAPAYTYTANTTNPLVGGAAFDYWQIEARSPVTRGVVVKLNRLINAGYLNGAADADVTNYNTDVDAVLAEFTASQWLAIDADTAMAKMATNFAVDNVHPNARGYAAIAGQAWSQLASWAAAIPAADIAIQSRVAKRVTSRRLSILKTNADPRLGLGYTPGNGTILAVNLPFAGVGTADYSPSLAAGPKVLDLTNLVHGIDADINDDIEVEVSGAWAAAAVFGYIDAAFLDPAGNVLRYFNAAVSTPATFPITGNPAWIGINTSTSWPITGKAFATVTAADIVTLFTVPGQVQVGLVATTFSSTRIINGGGASTSLPLMMQTKNVSKRNAGFNTS